MADNLQYDSQLTQLTEAYDRDTKRLNLKVAQLEEQLRVKEKDWSDKVIVQAKENKERLKQTMQAIDTRIS